MRFFERLFQFYINASIHVALAVCSLAMVTVIALNMVPDMNLMGFFFFGTISGYNFVKYAPAAGMHHRSLTRSLKTIQIFSFLCFGMVLLFAYNLPIEVLKVTACFGILTLLYTLPFVKHKSLRTISGLKIFIVATVWAGVTVVVPVLWSEYEFSADIWLSFFQRFLLVITLTLPFEIRDLPYDKSSLRTIPQQLGIKKAKATGIGFLVLILILEGFKDEIIPAHFLSLLVLSFITGILLVFSQKKQPKYFSSFGVESIPIVWMLIFLFLKYYLDNSC
ncbi:MAG: hypothetical protein AAFP76_01685 [Bacteroidota bacterium]